jgi:hypothetical protein
MNTVSERETGRLKTEKSTRNTGENQILGRNATRLKLPDEYAAR